MSLFSGKKAGSDAEPSSPSPSEENPRRRRAENPSAHAMNRERNASSSPSSDVNALISKDVEFSGKMAFEADMEIHGRFEGELEAKGPIVLGKSAVVCATVRAARTVRIDGAFKGDLTAEGQVTITATAKVYGTVKAPSVAVEAGAVLVGNTEIIGKDQNKPEEFSHLFNRLGKSDNRTPGSTTPSSPNGSRMESPISQPKTDSAAKS